MAKTQKTNSGSVLNEGELGSDAKPAANYPADQMENSAHGFTEGATVPVETKAKPKMKTLISGAEFWRFAPEEGKNEFDGEVFEGYFRQPQIREKDGKGEDQKAGSIIGYVFEQAGTGENYIIGNSHSIEKALKAAEYNKEKMMRFVYLGKGKNSQGQPFNRFEIAIEE